MCPNPRKGDHEMPFPGVIDLSLSVYQGFCRRISKKKGKKQTDRAKSGGGGLLRQSKDQKHLRTGTVVHLLGICWPVLVSHKYVCSNGLRARRIQRGFWPVWSEWAIRSGNRAFQLCEKTYTDTDRFVPAFTDLT